MKKKKDKIEIFLILFAIINILIVLYLFIS